MTRDTVAPAFGCASGLMPGCQYPLPHWWDKELLHFDNEACLPVLGQHRPAALGRPAR